MAFDAELGFDPDYCHCGQKVAILTESADSLYGFTACLVEDYCIHCALSRCDAFPGDCGRPSV